MKFPVLTHILIPPWPKSKMMILTLRSPLWSRAWGIMRERTYLGKSKPWSEMVYSCLTLKLSMQCAHHIVIISRASWKYSLKTKTPKLPFYEKSHVFFKTRDTNVFSFGLRSHISKESLKRTPWPSYEKLVLITNTDSLVMGSLCLSNQPPMALSLGHTVLRLWRRSLQLTHHQISTGDHSWDTNSRTLCLPKSLCTPTSHDPPAPQVSHHTIHMSCDRPTDSALWWTSATTPNSCTTTTLWRKTTKLGGPAGFTHTVECHQLGNPVWN